MNFFFHLCNFICFQIHDMLINQQKNWNSGDHKKSDLKLFWGGWASLDETLVRESMRSGTFEITTVSVFLIRKQNRLYIYLCSDYCILCKKEAWILVCKYHWDKQWSVFALCHKLWYTWNAIWFREVKSWLPRKYF